MNCDEGTDVTSAEEASREACMTSLPTGDMASESVDWCWHGVSLSLIWTTGYNLKYMYF